MARLLLDHGAKVNATNARGATPLHEACYKGNLQAAELLLRRGADTTVKDKDGC